MTKNPLGAGISGFGEKARARPCCNTAAGRQGASQRPQRQQAPPLRTIPDLCSVHASFLAQSPECQDRVPGTPCGASQLGLYLTDRQRRTAAVRSYRQRSRLRWCMPAGPGTRMNPASRDDGRAAAVFLLFRRSYSPLWRCSGTASQAGTCASVSTMLASEASTMALTGHG